MVDRGSQGRFGCMADQDQDYLVILGQGSTVVHTRRGRSTEYSVWVGWQGESSTHQHDGRETLVDGRWHLTILPARDRNRAPAVEVVQSLMDFGNGLLPVIGALTIAGPPYARPRHAGSEFPALYVVHVRTRAHDLLSSLLNQMERHLRLDHVHRMNFHLSIDEDTEDNVWEVVD